MKIDDNNDQMYYYDNLYQLSFVDYNDGISINYYYDVLGNRTSINDGSSISYSSNSLNQYSSVGGVSFAYDDNGNLANDGTYEYYYDCENRLTDVNENGAAVAAYEYDYRGRRISKVVDSNTIDYVYDGQQVVAEYENDTLVRKFIYGAGIDEPICMVDVSDNDKVYYYHFDGLGSVVALSDVNSDVVESYSYDVFGEPNRTSDVGNPYLFTGRRLDEETDNYYYRARYYSPNIGQFLQTDPMDFFAGINLYTYALNNSTNLTDPYGFWTVSIAVSGSASFGAGGGGSLAIVIDGQGNVGIMATGEVGGGTPNASIGVEVAGTNAASIESLEGVGGYGGMSGLIVEAGGISGDGYAGASVAIGPSALPASGRGGITGTTVTKLFNVGEVKDKVVKSMKSAWEITEKKAKDAYDYSRDKLEDALGFCKEKMDNLGNMFNDFFNPQKK